MPDSTLTGKAFLHQFNQHLSNLNTMRAAIKTIGGVKTKLREDSAPEWTNALLNIVLAMGKQRGNDVYPSGYQLNPKTRKNARYVNAGDRGEWMFDACWTRYPSNERLVELLRSVQAERAVLPARFVDLACESEWGGKTGRHHVQTVIDDFAKLVESRAPLKVMIFGYRASGPGSLEDLLGLFRLLAKSDSVPADYVLLGWEDGAVWSERLVRRGVEVLSVNK